MNIAPCLWFDGDAVEAVALYTSVLPQTRVTSVIRYTEGMPLPAGQVMLVEFDVAGRRFQALNGGHAFRPNPSISFFVQLDDADEGRRIFESLADCGQILMPMDAYAWSRCYGWVQDRFGVSWQIFVRADALGAPGIVPCLLFSGQVHGRAGEAMQRYSGLFPDAHVDTIERYGPGEGPVETVKHGRFTLAGEPFVAMDSHMNHGFAFNEGISLSVLCAGQAEVDRLWDALTDGGEPGPCGWLKDRFGVSWQVVPEALVRRQGLGDDEANARMYGAMMTMSKLDVATLERAWHGR